MVDNGFLGEGLALSGDDFRSDVIKGQISVSKPLTYLLLLAGMVFPGAMRTWRGSEADEENLSA